jgi:hypothetical protein
LSFAAQHIDAHPAETEGSGSRSALEEAAGIGRKELKIKRLLQKGQNILLACIDSEGSAVTLEKRKTYLALGDQQAEKRGLICAIDESGEDDLYPKRFFRSIALPQAVKRAVLAAA